MVDHKLQLHGWDDEKLYFIDESGKEKCVSDFPDLVSQLVNICSDYFKQQLDTVKPISVTDVVANSGEKNPPLTLEEIDRIVHEVRQQKGK